MPGISSYDWLSFWGQVMNGSFSITFGRKHGGGSAPGTLRALIRASGMSVDQFVGLL